MNTRILTAALTVICLFSWGRDSWVTAQAPHGYSVQNGYGFGLGVGYGSAYAFPHQCWPPGIGGFAPLGGLVISPVREDLPYFAKFPPVHYSGIVPRPYGISPFAAPPGIVPVEMTMPVPATPAVIKNPYFVPETSDEAVDTSDEAVDTTIPAQNTIETTHPANHRIRGMRNRPSVKIGQAQRVFNPYFGAPLAFHD